MKVEKRLTKELKAIFPKDFLWGAGVSAHQVDGGLKNQWTVWEKQGAQRFADEAISKWSDLPVWRYINDEATNPDNYISGNGIEHRKHYREDFKQLKQLGLNTFKFSIEWSEIEPEEGVYNLAAIKHYKSYINELIDLEITPVITLWHWTMPVWFSRIGGFSKRKNLTHWERYVHKLADELDWSKIKYVLTINEPNTYMGMSYVTGEFPPGQHHKYIEAFRNYYNLAIAHRYAYRILKSKFNHLMISPAVQINRVNPERENNLVDKLMSAAEEYFYWWFFRRGKFYDFVGMNHYFTDIRRGLSLQAAQPEPRNDMGFYMDPSGLEQAVLKAYKKLKKPVLITENGVADMQDKYRLWWLVETTHALAEARRHGAEVIGYIHWSLLDNFEWQYGWMQKFGLIEVDRNTMRRIPKKSALAWSKWLHYQ